MSLTQEQADARARGIGGSEAAAVCGISPWTTPVQLWQVKRGDVPPPDLSDNELVRWGELLEEVIGKEGARRLGFTVHRVRETKIDKEHPHMLANIDFRIVGKRAGLEVKNSSQWTSEKWGEIGTDDVPPYYLMQGVHYMRVLDYDEWYYAVLLGGNELLTYRVERDADIEKRLIMLEGRFWECVETGRAPPPIKIEDLTRLYKKTQGVKVATPEIVDLVARAREIKALVKPLIGDGGELDRIKLLVGAYLGEAGDLLDPDDHSLTQATYRANDVTRVDVDKVRKGYLKKQIIEALECERLIDAIGELGGTTREPEVPGHLAQQLATLKQLGPERFADLICASLLRTTSERKFLTK